MPAGPAARLGDMHQCPLSTGTVPHVGGVILPPVVVTVLIGGKPALVAGAQALCVGSVDSFPLGSQTVLIESKPAVRITDKSAHGGVVLIVVGIFLALQLNNRNEEKKDQIEERKGKFSIVLRKKWRRI